MWRSAVQLRAGLHLKNGGIAQLVEHLLCKQGVKSSNLFISTTEKKFFYEGLLFLFFVYPCLMAETLRGIRSKKGKRIYEL